MFKNYKIILGLVITLFIMSGCGLQNLPEESKLCALDVIIEDVEVCGKINVVCITTPCDPVDETFANRCAAEDAGAFDIVDGSCEDQNLNEVNSFEDCIKAGNPAMESYPRQCRHGDKGFTENIGNELQKDGLIRMDTPRPNQKVNSPLTITGEARGTWFFEGDFPVVLTDWDGLIIAESYATAEGDWMTEEFVKFSVELNFEKPELYDRGTLILKKDNPSGLSENDDVLEVPIYFN
ncbi:MAG: hypothetical protein HOA57_03095 [Candidatus Magasanikbacteria bacterium]|jgi:hypothetical protein|nr:hypothetical protein [Candidatus Magasanikbacteria bacterium]MBT4315124.1 hypothetical protein [Candidatus Magasanikbacteria bacterium]MBT4547420.1 hypothetical protein [Candidatus Magasanikbacteria bacterium]MBT6819339.1 hypothetical protein [Candidatus Magasanikbacteria bacterium]